MAIDLQSLDMFRSAAEWSGNTMPNLDKEIGADGTTANVVVSEPEA